MTTNKRSVSGATREMAKYRKTNITGLLAGNLTAEYLERKYRALPLDTFITRVGDTVYLNTRQSI